MEKSNSLSQTLDGYKTIGALYKIIKTEYKFIGGKEEGLIKMIKEYKPTILDEDSPFALMAQVLTGTCTVKSMSWKEIVLNEKIDMGVRLNAVRQIENEYDLKEIAYNNIILPEKSTLKKEGLGKPWFFSKIVTLAISQLSNTLILELINSEALTGVYRGEGLMRCAIQVCADSNENEDLYSKAIEIVKHTNSIKVLSQLNLETEALDDNPYLGKLYEVANKRIDELGL